MRFITYLTTLLLAVFLIACGGGGGAPGLPSGTLKPITTSAPATLTVAVGSTQNYSIVGGRAPYQIASTNAQVVVGSLDSSSFSITGAASGSASITISDSAQQTTTIAVTVGNLVDLYTTAPSTSSMSPLTNTSYLVGGGVPAYTATSSDVRIVSVALNGTTMTVSAVAVGAATITLRDSAGKTIQFAVTVGNLIALYSTAPSNLTIAADTQRSFSVGGGVPGYVVESTDNRVVVASMSGGSLNLRAVAAGSAQVFIRDTVNSTVTLNITVGGASPLGLYTSAPANVTLAKGTQTNYSVGGGVAGYVVTSGDTRIATVTLSGTTMSINAVAMGSTAIVVRDSGGSALAVFVTVAAASPEAFLSTAPSTLSMSAGSSLTFSVSGGSIPYSVASTDSRVATGSLNGSTLTIAALKAGNATLQLVDAVGKLIQIVVTADGSLTGAGGPASIDIQASSNTLASAPGSKISFVVTVKDAVNSAIPNQPVTFTSTSGTLTGANPAPSTDANGVVSSLSLSPGADASNRVISVTATSGSISKSISIPVTGSALTLAGAGSALVGNTALTFSVKALDSGGKPIVGQTLTVASTGGNTVAPSVLTTDVSGAATFSFTPVNPGTATLTVTGAGSSATASVVVSNQDFSFVAPVPAAVLNVNANHTVQVCYKVAGAVTPPTASVTFSTTRGSVGSATYPDAQGCASTTVTSATAGPVTISAQMGAVQTSVTAAFVAVTPVTIVLQANPGAVLPNASGSTSNQSTLSATVRDATGNPVAGQVVNFTATQDGSNGSIVPGSGTTDSNGMTSVQFVPGALSTAANGVVMKATVQSNPALTSTTTLTVNGNALFISIGVASTLTAYDTSTYQKDFSVYVTDANGAPAANRAVTVSLFPPTYGKGSLVWDAGNKIWKYSNTSPTVCVNEDSNRNGILDSGEGTFGSGGNGNAVLDPGLPVVISPSTVTTDATGYATFQLRYGKNYAWWLSTDVTARALVGGTESFRTASYFLEMLTSDAKSESTPANVTSPYGIATVCTNPN